MPRSWAMAALCIAAVGSLIFSTLTYSLREVSHAALSEALRHRRRARLIEPTIAHLGELIFATAVGRLLANTLIALSSVWICQSLIERTALRDATIFVLAAAVTLVFSVAIPQAISNHAAAGVIGATVTPLHAIRFLLTPLNWIPRLSDRFVRGAAGAPSVPEPEQIERQVEQEILSAVEQGERSGVVDEQEREMIKSVIEFHDSGVARVMTARTAIVALEVSSSPEEARAAIEHSGHSRIPVYERSLDQMVGVLYARDLLRLIGRSAGRFDLRQVLRPAYFVPETTLLGDLLREFRSRKIHIAIVLDEYGGTAGLVTLEDVLEQLVGEIGDEHEPADASLFNRVNPRTIEAGARIDIAELNRLASLELPENDDYTTLGGYLLSVFGQIPETGTAIERDGLKFTVLDATPQRINRVRIEQTAESPQPRP